MSTYIQTRSNPDFDDVSSREQQLLHHLPSHHIPRLEKKEKGWYKREESSHHDGVFGEVSPCFPHTINKVFGVTVGNVEADVADCRDGLSNELQLLHVLFS